MSYDIALHATTPPLVVTITDTVPINVTSVELHVVDENGAPVFVDAAPSVDASDPLAVVVTHTWLAGQTDVAGTYGVQVFTPSGSYPAAGPLPFTVGMGPLTPYCTIAAARAAGATGTDAEVSDAIMQARRRIDRYCADVFAPTRLELITNVRADGTALLWRTVRSIDSVRPVGGSSELPASSYVATSSRTPGGVDALSFGVGSRAGDPIIAGAEPWNGGWSNLLGSSLTGQIEVVGSFGWDETPPEVVNACAQLAASIRLGGAVGPDVDDDGNVVRVTVAGPDETRGESTGVALVDEQLAHLRRSQVRLGY